MDYQLMKLGDNLDYWRYKYKNCHKFFKAEYYIMYEKAKDEFGEYYKAKYPNAKVEPQVARPFIRLSDMTEVFEEHQL